MAQYRLSVSIVSRKAGRSATAMAAYRAGAVIEDRRTGERFDFTRRSGVLHSEMVLPGNAPTWAADRVEFWNRSELADKRVNAQVAREIQISLPHELNEAQRRALTLEFSRCVVERYNLAADVSIHAPSYRGDDRNHHAHLLLCTRPFDPESKTGFGNKNRDLDAIALQRSKKESEVEQLRAIWAEQTNRALQQADIRTAGGDVLEVDHRSYERRGIAQEPTVKEGPAATGLKRREEPSERVEINAEIQARNALRAQIAAALEQDQQQLAELYRQSSRQEKQPPVAGGEGITMTPEQKRREEEAGLPSLREAAEAFQRDQMEGGILRDVPERADTFRFDPAQNLVEQRHAYEQQLDMEQMQDEQAINRLQDQEYKEFINTLDKAHRELGNRDRREDQADNIKGLKILSSEELRAASEYRQTVFEGREILRRAEKDELRQTFEEHHQEWGTQRQEALTARYDLQRDTLYETYRRAGGPEEPDLNPPTPRRKDEDPPEGGASIMRRNVQNRTAASLQQDLALQNPSELSEAPSDPTRREAQNRPADDVRSDLTGPKETEQPPQPKLNFKPLPGETEAEAQKRSEQAQALFQDAKPRKRPLGR